MASEALKISLIYSPETVALAKKKKSIEGLTTFENNRNTRNCVEYLDKAK